MLKHSMLVLLTVAVSLVQGQSKGIDWKTSLDEALALAAKENKPILVAFNMDRERANDRMAREHYKDPAVLAIAGKYICLIASKFRHAEELDGICPRFGTVTCTQHISGEIAARKKYLKTVNVESPQHLILRPDGTLFRKKVWFMSTEQLADLLSKAHRDLFPDQYTGDVKGGQIPVEEEPEEEPEEEDAEEDAEDEPVPVTPKEIRDSILKKRDIWEIKKLARELMKKEAPLKQEADEILDDLLSNKEYQVEVTCGLLLAHGFRGNKKAVKKVAKFLSHKEEKIRSHAAVALEDIADQSAYTAVRKQLKREKEDNVTKNLVRAFGVVGNQKRGSVETVLELTKARSSVVARNAIVALSNFKRSSKAEKELISIAFKSGFGGRGGRRGGGRAGFGASLRKVGAALYSLGELESKKARKEIAKRLERERVEQIAEFYQGVLDRIDGKVDVKSAEYKKKRQEAASDRIRRDLDPEIEEREGRREGRRGRRGEGSDDEEGGKEEKKGSE